MGERRRRMESGTTTTTTILDLPPDVLLLILTRLSQGAGDYIEHLSSLSLVSKPFRSVFCRFVNCLKFDGRLPSDSAIRKLLARFSSVSRIVIRSSRIVRALTAIAKSGLKIEFLEIQGKPRCPNREQILSLSGKFGAVKALKLEWFANASELDVAEFVRLFPSLEDLDFVYPWSGDVGIEELTSKAPNLRKLILRNTFALADRDLAVLSNCVNLEQVSLHHFARVNVQSFSAFVRNSRNLKCLDMQYSFVQNDDILTLAEAISSCENLSHLSLNETLTKDAFLSVIAKSPSPLTSLDFTDFVSSLDYTMMGLSAMLCGFQNLTKLHVATPWRTQDAADQDMQMSQLVKSLPRLREVYIISLSALYATLFSLIHNCSVLESIHMNDMSSNPHFDVPQQIEKNYSIQHIVFRSEPIHAVKKALKLACPSLKTFIFGYHMEIRVT